MEKLAYVSNGHFIEIIWNVCDSEPHIAATVYVDGEYHRFLTEEGLSVEDELLDAVINAVKWDFPETLN